MPSAFDGWAEEIYVSVAFLTPFLRSLGNNLSFCERIVASAFLLLFYPVISLGILHQAASTIFRKSRISRKLSLGCDVLFLYALTTHPAPMLLIASSLIPWVVVPRLDLFQWTSPIHRTLSQNLVWAGQQPFTGLRINIKTKDGNLDVPNGKGFKATGTSAPVKIPPSNPSMRKGCKAPLGDEDWLLVRKEVPLIHTMRNDSAVSVLQK